jgi:hypothetical protein
MVQIWIKHISMLEMSSLAKGAKLLDSDDDDKADDAGLSINRAYADRYDNWRRLEEMQKCI